MKKRIETENIEYWAIKYTDEPNLTKSRILHEAQLQLSQKDFSELLLNLIDKNQDELTKKGINIPK